MPARDRGRFSKRQPHPSVDPLVFELVKIAKDEHMLQTDIAKRAGFDRTTIWRWESGYKHPTFANFEAAVNACAHEVVVTVRGKRVKLPEGKGHPPVVAWMIGERQRQQLTQAEFGRRIGRVWTTVSTWERRAASPKLTDVRKGVAALGGRIELRPCG